jgi:hypothetical protein
MPLTLTNAQVAPRQSSERAGEPLADPSGEACAGLVGEEKSLRMAPDLTGGVDALDDERLARHEPQDSEGAL